MTRVLRRAFRKVMGRLRPAAAADGPRASQAATAEGHARPRRDLAVVIETPPGMPPGVDAPPLGRLLVARRAARPQDVTLAVMQQGEGDERPIGEILVDHGATTAAQVVEALGHQAEAKRAVASTSVRVDTDLIEALAQLVVELAETRDDLRRRLGATDDEIATRLDAVCVEMHDVIHRMRQPVDPDPDAGS